MAYNANCAVLSVWSWNVMQQEVQSLEEGWVLKEVEVAEGG